MATALTEMTPCDSKTLEVACPAFTTLVLKISFEVAPLSFVQKLVALRLLATTNIVTDMELIAATGNTEVPCYLTLIKAGFEVSALRGSGQSERWIAKKPNLILEAGSPLELLGLWSMREDRGPNWKASDDEIEAFLKCFYPDKGS